MKLIARLVFLSLLLFGSYLLLSALSDRNSASSQILQQVAEQAMAQQLCQTPVLWRIGQLDPAFGLTADDAEQAAHNAAMQWNRAAGRELFRYDSIDGFAINFRYDERQQQLLHQALLERNLQRYDSNIDRRSDALKRQSEQLRRRQQQFEADNQQFAADIAAFEQQAQQLTSANRAALMQQQQELQQRQQQLQQQADQLNAEQDQLVREQSYLNDTVVDRNALLPEAQPLTMAEVGLMEIQNGRRTMTIFAYKTAQALELTLAHEFGHALGLGHLDDSSAIMYFALNPGQQQLTGADLAALANQCGQ